MICGILDFIGTCACNCVLDTFYHQCNILTQVLNLLHYGLLALKLNNCMSRNKNNDFATTLYIGISKHKIEEVQENRTMPIRTCVKPRKEAVMKSARQCFFNSKSI
jgi:hypothetical protein